MNDLIWHFPQHSLTHATSIQQFNPWMFYTPKTVAEEIASNRHYDLVAIQIQRFEIQGGSSASRLAYVDFKFEIASHYKTFSL